MHSCVDVFPALFCFPPSIAAISPLITPLVLHGLGKRLQLRTCYDSAMVWPGWLGWTKKTLRSSPFFFRLACISLTLIFQRFMTAVWIVLLPFYM